MIPVEVKNANEIKFMELLTRFGVDLTEFNKFLESVDFFNKPFSAQYQGNYPGGLCEHALRLANELGSIATAYYPGRYSDIDILAVALFKDIYKATMYECYQKNVKDDQTGQWVTIPAYRTKEEGLRPVFGDIGFSSYMQIKDYFTLTNEQIEAIVFGRPGDFGPDIHEIMRAYPLVTLTRMAEEAVTYLS